MTQQSILPAIYFPTRVLLLDDDPKFLKALADHLSSFIPVEALTDVDEAFKVLKDNRERIKEEWIYFEDIINDDTDESIPAIAFNLEKLNAILKNKQHPNYISILIIDYSMPGMNGIEFCKKIQGIPVRKIMLTGVADYQTAVEAFNQGYIDQFIVKDVSNLDTKLKEAIQEQQKKFFELITHNIAHLLLNKKYSSSVLSSYQNQLLYLLSKIDVASYHLLDEHGSYLFLEKSGKKTYFIVRNESAFDNLIDVMNNSDDADESLLNMLQERKAMPVLLDQEALESPISSWPKYMQTFSPLKNAPGLYYSILES